jgi:hypothetical protein
MHWTLRKDEHEPDRDPSASSPGVVVRWRPDNGSLAGSTQLGERGPDERTRPGRRQLALARD